MAKSEPKRYYRTVVTVEVLTDEPFKFEGLHDLREKITWGHASAQTAVFAEDQVDRRTIRKMLVAQGSDPNLFDRASDTYDDDDGLEAPTRWFRDDQA